ncbi:unnamed protein product [Ixodes hexagonus]
MGTYVVQSIMLSSCMTSSPDHAACISAKSDERLIYYFCGYVARKFVLKANCDDCHALLLTNKVSVKLLKAADCTRLRDKGGLLYPSGYLFRFIRKLENLFTSCFSTQELHHESVLDLVAFVQQQQDDSVGCDRHSQTLTAQMIASYVTTHLPFFFHV